jgi:outer membrane PBP1 activator LpoA protein
MIRIQEIKIWLEEGKLQRAEDGILDCMNNLKPDEKEEFENLLSEISVRHFRVLAGKALLSKDEILLRLYVQKLKEKNAHVEGLQSSLDQIVSERRNIRFQKMLIILFGLITLVFFTLFLLI